MHERWIQLKWMVNWWYCKEQLFWAFQFLSAAVWTRFLKLKRIVSQKTGSAMAVLDK